MLIASRSLPADPPERTGALRFGPVLVLTAMVATYAGVFGFLVYRQHSNFATFGFDIGIHDQGIWLVSQGRSPFVTVRGLDYFAHHVNLISVAFVPFYWLGAGPHFLIIAHTLVVALGAFPLWLLTRDRLGRPWIALAVPLAYLLYPALQWITWWAYHPDSLAITPLLFAWWLATRRRWGWFTIAVAVALSCKEDVALSVVMLGLVVAFWLRPLRKTTHHPGGRVPANPVRSPDHRPDPEPRAPRSKHRRHGLVTAAVGAAWYLIATRVVIPWRNHGSGPFYDSFFPALGSSIPQVLWNAARHPSRVWHLARLPDRVEYYRQMFLPVAFLPVLALPALLVGAPQFGVNVTAQVVQGATIKSQYASLPLLAIFLGTAEALGWLNRQRLARLLVPVAAVVVTASSLAGTFQWGISPLGRHFHGGVWVAHNPRAPEMHQALRLVPGRAGVSVTYYLTPQLTHRATVFEFPNPWVGKYYGRSSADHGDPATVDWLILDRLNFTTADLDLFNRLTSASGQFTIAYDDLGIVAARRSRR